jgi:hypothetical protein
MGLLEEKIAGLDGEPVTVFWLSKEDLLNAIYTAKGGKK